MTPNTRYQLICAADLSDEWGPPHYTRASDQPEGWERALLSDKESDYAWARHGERTVDAITMSAKIPEEAAEHIYKILDERHSCIDAHRDGEETEFSGDAHYQLKSTSDESWKVFWQSFEISLKTKVRFFNREAFFFLKELFSGIKESLTRDGRPLVIDAGPGTSFNSVYRARVFQSDEKLKAALCRPDLELGSPPMAAANVGRMNARGISVFYGANTPQAAIAEVRPPVGSKVAVAKFDIVRPLKLLDLTALGEVDDAGSVFDPGFRRRKERSMFLHALSQRITRPVMPDDEHFEYLATQAIADFLADAADTLLHGILYPSVQIAGNGLNIVLFHKAAQVEEIEIAKGTEFSTSFPELSDEYGQLEYLVFEKNRTEQAEKIVGGKTPDISSETRHLEFGDWGPDDFDTRAPTLRIVIGSLQIHLVRGVKFTTDPHPVARIISWRR